LILAIVGKVLAIFLLVFVGLFTRKSGWLPAEASKILAKIVINIAAPCVTVLAMAGQERSAEHSQTVLIVLFMTAAGYAVAWGASLPSERLCRVPAAERGVFRNAMLFTNNGFMGLPIAYAVFGSEGLFYAAIYNCFSVVGVFTLGIFNARRDARLIKGAPEGGAGRVSTREFAKNMLSAPVLSAIIGLVLYFFQIPIPSLANDVLDSLGNMMTPMAMMVIGIQLAESSPKALIGNRSNVLCAFMRLIVIPLVLVLLFRAFGVGGLLLSVTALNFILPSAAAPTAIAEDVGAKALRAAELTFTSTLFSMITVPVWIVLLHVFLP